MRRVLAPLLAVILAGGAGCTGGPPATGTGATGRPADAAATSSPSPSPTPDPVDVYAAAISRYLSGTENSFPGTTFPVVFVLDRLDPAAASVDNRDGPATPLTPAQRQRIAAQVTVTFVASLDSVVTTGDSACTVVRDNGVFIALGPATPTGADTAQVAVHGFVACQGATWFTYVLRRDATGWTVTGTTGRTAVA